MASDTQFSVNMPHDARRMWDMLKRGHTHTRVAMAGIAAWASLDREAQDELMMLVASVSEQGAPWSDVLKWAEDRRDAASAEAALREADAEAQQQGTKRKRQKTGRAG